MNEQLRCPTCEAGSYRTPMKVMAVRCYISTPDKLTYPICPRCNKSIEREYQSFCDRCGQALEWKDFPQTLIGI